MIVAPLLSHILHEPKLFGVSLLGGFILCAITLVMVLALRQYWFLAVSIVLFRVTVGLTKRDPEMIEILFENMRIKEVYD